MTKPVEQREAGTAAMTDTAPEAIEDLEVAGDDADAVVGGDLTLKSEIPGESVNNTKLNQIAITTF